ncbi:LysR family transcriptional regulator [Aureimonas jatrophae]|uniref:DNA-binding transcriptional regulator, LysR family n=1 Tax=Aureimonas jatrophae TaxID=1166073 RepID=A0A1H0F9G7_9HYPH|nr:LysR family transcriptional regulator [Aureimonas jatrophae]MBB3950118.1 DNA-binding transcriptional LysR family regulator [Aureimonas jatrophae]SDN91240.1 DNA-binding transcriptional regulator, LysR family [Aureimonas jatrophae]
MEHLPQNVDWDSVKVFLAVADSRSFRQASAELGKGINTLRATIERLEDQLGFRLFYREAEGTRLTNEGRRLVAAARDVQRSVADMCRVAQSTSDTMSGAIHLAVTEGIGTFWIIPQLVDFLRGEGRDINLNLECALRSVDVLRLEADISIQLTEPTAPDLIKKRLGFVHLSMFAGRSYVEAHGLPTSLADLANHRVVEQETEQFAGYRLAPLFGEEIARKMVPLRTNFSSAHYWAVAKGAGIGMLPNYAIAIGADLVPVNLDMKLGVEVWLAIHPEVIKTARHRVFVDWLVECFSREKYPWFGNTALHPDEIVDLLRASGELQTYFEGFTPKLAAAPETRRLGKAVADL